MKPKSSTPALASLFAFLSVSLAFGQTATGRITGTVTNSSGTAYLEGAVVTVDGTNRTSITDRRGEFDFGAMAPGEYSLHIAYTGMTPATARVVVAAGQAASITTTLSEDVVKMGAFSVTTNRNADALALTEQRNAPNVKNVVDIAAYGMLNNDNPAELLQLLPGVAGSLFFRADAQFRSKIGLSPGRAKDVLGSYDAANHTLTLVKFTLPKGATDYVNSMWKLQDDPFSGDAVNSYNDDGKLGRFYELESSSPALALKPGAAATHRHQTIHLQGDEKELDAIAQATLGVRLSAVRSAFK